ncbi:KxYKxGKxW signal peptide domain-containing protein [Secundilactobacillus mixtipabuli]|uniref:Cell envelope-associated proteinase PrtR n=1 Tax=Secundilactobacillus mixtipabuli TaxID=1435342 RepID=A0A1Z5IEC7_9LACO|nr:KxYKxGKxW signal peptide domain-containing protein [Secundilactobacillus mixtipabuli]GAX00120.1 cell envelope-associated proteinase PrtR [Secundilactobacillus mixtipabuli]
MMIEKKHYKMYKSGRNWLFAAITVLTIGASGLLGVQASAETQAAATTTTTQADQSSQTGSSLSDKAGDSTGSTPDKSTGDASTGATSALPPKSDTTTQKVGVPTAGVTQWDSTAKVTLPAATTTTGDNTANINQDQSTPKTSNATLAVKDANSFNLDYTITNPSKDTATKIFSDFLLPKFFDHSTTALVQNDFDIPALIQSQPNLEFTFSVNPDDPGNYDSYDAIKAANPDFTPSQLLAIYIQSSALGKGESYTLSVPMTIANAEEVAKASTGNDFQAAVYNYKLNKAANGFDVTESNLDFTVAAPKPVTPVQPVQPTGPQTVSGPTTAPATPLTTPTQLVGTDDDAANTAKTPDDQTSNSSDQGAAVSDQKASGNSAAGNQSGDTANQESTTGSNVSQGSVTTSQNAGTAGANGAVKGATQSENAQSTNQLPQTSESASQAKAAASLGIFGLLSILGLAKRRKLN